MISKNKSLLITLSVAIFCLLLSLYFPAESPFQKITRSIFFLFVIPAFYIKTILKKSLSDFGLNLKNNSAGFFTGTFVFIGIILSFYLIQKYFGLEKMSLIPQVAVDNFFWFVFYELVFVNISLFCLEFFFRGFLFFSLLEKFSYQTIIIQAIFYTATTALASPSIENLLQSLSIAILSGILTFRTRSFVYSYGIMLLASILIDAFIIHTLK